MYGQAHGTVLNPPFLGTDRESHGAMDRRIEQSWWSH